MLPMAVGNALTHNGGESCVVSAMFDCRPHGCPCGYLTDPRRECHCTPRQIRQYLGRISGPLLDRIDIQVEVPAVHYRDLRSPLEGEPSAVIRERVIRAREMQIARFGGSPARRSLGEGGKVFCNARMTGRMVKKFCKVDGAAEASLSSAIQQFSRICQMQLTFFGTRIA